MTPTLYFTDPDARPPFAINLHAQRWIDGGIRAYAAGISGSGKTNLIAVFCEELYPLEVPILIFDPKNEYRSLKELGRRVTVIGKGHGADFELTYPGADWVHAAIGGLKRNHIVVVEVKELSSASDKRVAYSWLTDALLRHQEKYRSFMFYIVEEAHIVCPQKRQQDLDAIELTNECARLGRSNGLNLFLASQRPRALEADIASQCNLHFCGRVEMSLDYEAMEYLLRIPPLKSKPPRGMATTRVFDRPGFNEVIDLATGQFYVRIGKELHLVQVKRRKTTHLSKTPVVCQPRLPVFEVSVAGELG